MGGLSFRLCSVLECAVVLFQICGIAALCLHRLFPATRWAKGSRIGFVIALLGLGVAGGLCGRHDSHTLRDVGVRTGASLASPGRLRSPTRQSGMRFPTHRRCKLLKGAGEGPFSRKRGRPHPFSAPYGANRDNLSYSRIHSK